MPYFHLCLPHWTCFAFFNPLTIALIHQVVDDEMDSHGSDDSETFTTPPASITAGNDSDRLQTECPDGEEAMEEEDKDDEWKSIMPEVGSLGDLVSFIE